MPKGNHNPWQGKVAAEARFRSTQERAAHYRDMISKSIAARTYYARLRKQEGWKYEPGKDGE